MSCVELFLKPNFGRRIRRVVCATAAAAGWPKIGPHFYNSIGGAAAPAPVTAVVGGTGTTDATITFGGGPAPAAGTVTLTAEAHALTITGLTPVAIAKGDTAAAVATKVAAMLNGKQDAGPTVALHSNAVGPVVHVAEAGGNLITGLTAVVA